MNPILRCAYWTCSACSSDYGPHQLSSPITLGPRAPYPLGTNTKNRTEQWKRGHWAVPWAIPTLPTALADCVRYALSSVSSMPYFIFLNKSAVRIEFRRVQLALKSFKCLFFCSYLCCSYFLIIIVIIIPSIFYTFYVALENSKTFPQQIKFSEKIWKDP